MSQHTPPGRNYQASAVWREPYAHRLTSDDIIVLSDMNRKFLRRAAIFYFCCGAGFGAAVMALILSLRGHL